MAYHTPIRKGITAEEQKAESKYIKPHSVFCNGERIKESDYSEYIVDYIVVQSGIVHYHTHHK